MGINSGFKGLKLKFCVVVAVLSTTKSQLSLFTNLILRDRSFNKEIRVPYHVTSNVSGIDQIEIKELRF